MPEPVTVAMADVAETVKEGLLALSVGPGPHRPGTGLLQRPFGG